MEKEASLPDLSFQQHNHIAMSAAAALKNVDQVSALVGLLPSARVTLRGEPQHVTEALTKLSDRMIVDSALITLRPKG
jgi:erythromycin esterase-like protein